MRRFPDSECPVERVRTVMASRDPHDGGLWKTTAELGWKGLFIPGQYGGPGLAREDLVGLAGRCRCARSEYDVSPAVPVAGVRHPQTGRTW